MSVRHIHHGWDDPWEGILNPSRLFDQHIGSIIPDVFYHHSYPSHHHFSRCPVCHCRERPSHQKETEILQATAQQNGVSEVVNSENEFRVSMDVQHFKPDEINIKTKDNRVIIRAQHDERADEHGFITREFTRQYVLPKDVDPDSVTSSLSRNGVLTLKAPKKALEAPKERVIPITQETEDGQEEDSVEGLEVA